MADISSIEFVFSLAETMQNNGLGAVPSSASAEAVRRCSFVEKDFSSTLAVFPSLLCYIFSKCEKRDGSPVSSNSSSSKE